MKNNSVISGTMKLDGHTIEYDMRKSNRAKYLQIRITSDNRLEVVLPRGVQPSEGRAFLEKKQDWIKKYAGRLSDESTAFLYLGETITIKHEYDLFVTKHHFSFYRNTLTIKSPESSIENTEALYEVFVKYAAKKYLIERTMYLAQKHGFHPKRVSVRNQKTRWGSCSSNRTISLNANLIKHRMDLIDYVIVHELCHMREMNHSPAFWNEVGKIIPNYKILRKELKAGSTE